MPDPSSPSPLLRLLPVGFVLGLSVLPGCFALEPRLPAHATVPTQPALLLLELPGDVAEELVRAPVVEEFEQAVRLGRLRTPILEPVVRQHRVVTGMTAREVVWALGAPPVRMRDRGPPGGRIYCWEPGRYWVRFDETGAAVSAGRY